MFIWLVFLCVVHQSAAQHACDSFGTWDAATAHLTIEVNMTAAMPDDCKNAVVSLDITTTVTTLPDYFMFNAQLLESVVIPGSLTTIWWNVFRYCYKLHSVTLQPGLRQLGVAMFQSTNLTSIEFPETLERVGYYTFRGCINLQTITFNNGLQIIEDTAFLSCTSLRSIVLPANLIQIQYGAFAGCTSLSSIVFNDALQVIATRSFITTALTSIDIPASVTLIGSLAFGNTSNLLSVNLRGQPVIASDAFDGAAFLGFCPTPITGTSYSCPLTTTPLPPPTTSPSSTISPTTAAPPPSTTPSFSTTPPSPTTAAPTPSTTLSPTFVVTSTTAPSGCNNHGTLYENGTLVVPTTPSVPLSTACGTLVKQLIFGSNVTSVPAHYGTAATQLVMVVVPATLVSVGDQAFANLPHLLYISIEGNTTTFGDSVLQGTPIEACGLVDNTALECTWEPAPSSDNTNAIIIGSVVGGLVVVGGIVGAVLWSSQSTVSTHSMIEMGM